MQKTPYRFYLRTNDTAYLAVAGSQVTTIATKTPILQSVANWDEIQCSWVRNGVYKGIFRKQSSTIKFVKDGAAIMRYLYYTQGGITAYCELVIEILDDTTQEYITQFVDTIDFATFHSTRDQVEVNTMQGGLAELVDAYGSTDYEVPIDDADCVRVNMDGIILKTAYRYLSSAALSTVGLTEHFSPVVLRLAYVRQEGDIAAGYGQSSDADYFPAIKVPNFTAIYNTTINVQYDFDLEVSSATGNNSAIVYFRVWSGQPDSSTLLNEVAIYTSPVLAPFASLTTNVAGSIKLNLAAGNTFIAEIKLADTSGTRSCAVIINPSGEKAFYINCETNSAQSTDRALNARKGYRWWQVMDKLTQKLSDGKYKLQTGFTSQSLNSRLYYDAIPLHTIMLSEQSLKTYTSSPVIKVKLSDMIKDIIARHQAGLGVKNNQLVVEHLSSFYDKNTVLGEISSITDLEIIADPDSMATTVECGYEGGDGIDDINKVNEYNDKVTRTLPNTKYVDSNKNKMDMVSPFYAAMNYIELVRLQNLDNTVAVNNTKRDDTNRNFLVYINSTATDGIYDLDRTAVIKGVDFPERAYNAALTPARNIMRCAGVFKSIMHGYASSFLKFQTAEQDKATYSTFPGSVTVVERADIEANTLIGQQLYQPYIFKFKGIPPKDLFDILESNPYGVFKFNYRNIDLYGFVLSVGINYGRRQLFDFELLSSPVNDLSKLIY
ncbi:MAG: hypothetical protein J0H46_15115 [Bacteroidetes bacterium]|nr:hypothetical protein [Bacteroidota bacterium]